MRVRSSARILLLNRENKVLLFRFENASDSNSQRVLWLTPGGAVDPGESFEEAAIRELYEEVGLRITDPGPRIHHRYGQHTAISGEQWIADEQYFLLRVDALEIDRTNWTEEEKKNMTAHHWWTAEELSTSTAEIVPANLTEILIKAGVWSVFAPESTSE